ncbi:MAG: pilus assembly protein TadG-related protein [Rhodobacterales bacterium]|nr:pilus assembly protein TadG-related protein [Rhodobacterales bacterium]
MLVQTAKYCADAQTKEFRESRPMVGWLNNFKRDESGVLVVFSVFFFLIILLVGGLGVDIMRTEMTRTRLQHAADNAALAAADLDQILDPTAVVTDYFTKAGMASYLDGVTVDEGLGYRIVDVDVSTTINTQLIHMVGIDTMSIGAASTAEERIDSVEISLVLDISGSMGSNSRLTNLKVAAKEFVDTIMDTSAPGKVSISIVPYATQVSAGPTLLAQYNVTAEHSYSDCVNFVSTDFSNTSLSTADQLQRTGPFDVWSYSTDPITYPVCNVDTASDIRALSMDRAVLKAQIDSLVAGGNTSIDVGMKWGTVLLDPGTQGVISNLIAGGSVPAEFAGRPVAYDSNDTLKVIVLMTDGQNTSQYYLTDDYRSGNSNVWYNAQKNRYSIYYPSHSGSNDYYWPHNGDWEDHPYGDNESGTAVRMTFPQLWNQVSVLWNYYYNYRPIMGSAAANAWYYDVWDYVGSGTKNARLNTICGAAKTNGVVVYSIGFEAPAGGQSVLQSCASSDSHYYDVDGIEIRQAFSAIASSIRKLKLTN